jgi:broad specificity phosphatase PhoE
MILMVRHGRTPTTGKVLPGRAKGLHLSDDGVAEAKRVAERIAEMKKVAAIYASPLERTRETAAPIAKALGLDIVTQGLARVRLRFVDGGITHVADEEEGVDDGAARAERIPLPQRRELHRDADAHRGRTG